LEVNMPRTRAYRRHQRDRALARAYRVVLTYHSRDEAVRWDQLRPQARHFHWRCNCWDDPHASALRRRREEREWRKRETT
jgi:hypothetical protein